jgi:hypothetical protein
MAAESTTHTIFVVQYYDARYDLWSNCARPEERSMFESPRIDYPTFDAASARYEELRAASPTGVYKVIELITTERVLVTNAPM